MKLRELFTKAQMNSVHDLTEHYRFWHHYRGLALESQGRRMSYIMTARESRFHLVYERRVKPLPIVK